MDPTPGTDRSVPERPARPPLNRRRTIVSWLLLAVMVLFVAIALERNWSAVSADLSSMGLVSLGLAFGAGVLALTTSGLIWRRVLHSMGYELDVKHAATVFYASQLGKYIPGAVWPVVIQTELGRAHRIPRSTMTASYLAVFAAVLAAGAPVGLLALTGDTPTGVPAVVALGSTCGSILAIAILHPRGMRGLGDRLAKRFGRQLPPIELSRRAIVEAVLGSVVVWCLYGIHCWLLARSLGAGAADLPPITGAFALAFIAGLVAIPIPAGAGVREGVLVLVLADIIGRQPALSVALASRLVLIVAEIALALVAGVPHSIRWAAARRARRAELDRQQVSDVANPNADAR